MRTLLTPLVNLESTLLLFATVILHRCYFGPDHPIADFMALHGMEIAITVYAAFVLLVSLTPIPAGWRRLVAFMVFLGTALISIAYTALFWMEPSTPSWLELIVQLYYLLQAILSLVLVILLLTQEEGTPLAVTPRLGNVPHTVKSLAILAYVAGVTLLLHRVFSIPPDRVTDQVNLSGAILLEFIARISSHGKAEAGERTLRYFFDAGSGICLWSGDEATRRRHGVAVSPDQLPLSEATRREINRLVAWYDTSIDWGDPAGPSPWSPAERRRFDVAAQALLDQLRAELETFSIEDQRPAL